MQTVDTQRELADAVDGELWLAAPREGARKMIRRAGLDEHVRLAPTIDAALAPG